MSQPSVLLLHGVTSASTTWWRNEEDLTELGWEVVTLDLAGHGGRARSAGTAPWLEELAADVLTRITRTFDVVVGHSLGALVALTLVAARPTVARGVFIVDPPGLGGRLDPKDVAAGIERAAIQIETDPRTAVEQALADNPRWSRHDAEDSLASSQILDIDYVTAMLRSNRWDLPALVRASPVPVHLLAATPPGSVLFEPDRTQVFEAVSSVTEVNSTHSVHRDRPALWLHDLVRFHASLPETPAGNPQ